MGIRLSFVACLFLGAISQHAKAFTDQDFEKILLENNVELKALFERKSAFAESVEEADVIYGWGVQASAGFLEDWSPSEDRGLSYRFLRSYSSQIAVSKKSPWGLQTRLGIEGSRSFLKNADFGAGAADSTQWLSRPSLELRLPLWADFGGRKTRADHQSLLQQKRLEALQAEMAYDEKFHEALTLLWSTVLQRESLKNQEETLQRIEKIYAISLNNSKRNLEASSNFLQARASLEQAKLDLKNSKLRAGQLERLLGIVLQRFKSFVLPAYDFSKFRPISLEDYRSKVSARQRLATVSLNLDRSLNLSRIEQERPSLDVVGAYSQSGVDSAWGRSFGESWGTSQPKFYLGLQLSFPLDLSLAGRSRARREQLAQAAVAREQYLRSEQDPVLVEDLVSQHNQLVELLAMNIVLEKTQKDKITNERKLLDQGRSSIYQVLQFELDLARAQAGKFSLALELEKIKQQLSLNKYVTYE